MKSLLMALVLTVSAQAFAQEIELTPCDESGASIESLMPGLENQKSYYNGQVALYKYNTLTPETVPYGIAIAFSDPTELPEGYKFRKCLAVRYLNEVDLAKAVSKYNPKTGLTVTVPYTALEGEDQTPVPAKIEIKIKTINTGTMSEGHTVSAKKI